MPQHMMAAHSVPFHSIRSPLYVLAFIRAKPVCYKFMDPGHVRFRRLHHPLVSPVLYMDNGFMNAQTS